MAGHLQAEIHAAKAGDSQGQFPILDLIGNLRDDAGAHADLAALVSFCAEAWERMVRIVESGQPFTADDIAWLQTLLARVQALVGVADSSAAAPAPPPAAPPAATSQPAEIKIIPTAAVPDAAIPAEEAPLNLNLADDADLLREFITESREHLDNIEQGVLVLENAAGGRRDAEHGFPRVPHVQGRRGLSQSGSHQPARAHPRIAARPRAAGQADD